MKLKVFSIQRAAEGVVVVDLRDQSGQLLPPAEPGAHLEITLPSGIVRQYSIFGDPAERHRYCIGVGWVEASRGGSRYIHESLQAGDTLEVSAPKNNFPLVTDAREYVFVAGGIGITPILSMIRWCVDRKMRWRLFYCVRSSGRAAFLEQLKNWSGCGSVTLHVDETAGRLFEPSQALQGISPHAHIYCCGPTRLMEEVQASAASLGAGNVHFEWFTPIAQEHAESGSFTALIRSTGERLEVPADRSLLDVLEQHGWSVPSSCREGLCATCQTGVLSGIPDHRDTVLSHEQRRSNQHIIACVSRAKTALIELDL